MKEELKGLSFALVAGTFLVALIAMISGQNFDQIIELSVGALEYYGSIVVLSGVFFAMRESLKTETS